MVRSVPGDEWTAPSGSSAYEPTTYGGVDRSPLVRPRKLRFTAIDQQQHDSPSRDDPSSSSGDEAAPDMPDSPSPTERRSHQTGGEAGEVERANFKSRAGPG